MPVLLSTHGGGSQCKHRITAFLLLYAAVYFQPLGSMKRELIVIWFLCGISIFFVGVGKEGRGVQHRSSVSAHVERQEQYPGWLISTGEYDFLVQVRKVCKLAYILCNLLPWSLVIQGAYPAVTRPCHFLGVLKLRSIVRL